MRSTSLIYREHRVIYEQEYRKLTKSIEGRY